MLRELQQDKKRPWSHAHIHHAATDNTAGSRKVCKNRFPLHGLHDELFTLSQRVLPNLGSGKKKKRERERLKKEAVAKKRKIKIINFYGER
jgi:hypothetical protein